MSACFRVAVIHVNISRMFVGFVLFDKCHLKKTYSNIYLNRKTFCTS